MRQRTASIQYTASLFFVLAILMLASGCHAKEETKEPLAPEPTIQNLAVPEEEFRQVIGWVDQEEILIQTAGEKEALQCFNIKTGEQTMVYEEDDFIIYALLSPDKDRILLQKASDERTELLVMTLQGEIVQSRKLEQQGYVTADWNQESPFSVLLAYHYFDQNEEEQLVVENWDLQNNDVTPVLTPSLDVQWYSSNLYLYIDHEEDFDLASGKLYVGDIRTGENWPINHRISSFYLYEDHFIAMAPSDFSETDLLLTYEYPFMVEKGFLTVPKATMNGRLSFPPISQGARKGKIYAIIPQKPVKLEEETGEFHLVEMDFEEKKIYSVLSIPESAPIAVSPDEKYILYGWRLENIIDLQNKALYPLLSKKG